MNLQKAPFGIGWTRFVLADGTTLPGFTANPIAGCSFGCSWDMPGGGQATCYAEALAKGRAKDHYPDGFDSVYWRPHLLEKMKARKKSAAIFLGSQADIFGVGVTDIQIKTVLQTIRECPQYIVMLLTKNANRLSQFVSDIPLNAIVGVSAPPTRMNGVEVNRDRYMRNALEVLTVLKKIYGVRTMMSLEPLSFDATPYLVDYVVSGGEPDWCLIGAVSKAKHQPERAWVRHLHGYALLNETAVYHKSNLKFEGMARRMDFPKPPMGFVRTGV